MMEYHIFPFGEVNKGSTVVLYGGGVVGTQYYEQLIKTEYCRKIIVIDRDYQNSNRFGFRVYSPREIMRIEFDYIVVSQAKCEVALEIMEQLKERGIDKEKIIWDDQVMENNICSKVEGNYKQLINMIHIVEQKVNTIGTQTIALNTLRNNDVRMRQVLVSLESMMANSIYGEKAYVPSEIAYYKALHTCLLVKTVENHNLLRIGNVNGDGGYVMLDDLYDASPKIAYSFGINDDVTWDDDISKYGYDVYMYDHTIAGLPRQNKRFHFSKVGLADAYEKEGKELKTLETILEENGHSQKRNLILKADVEGAEYGFLEITDSKILSQFDQIILEFHNVLAENNRENVIRALTKISNTHVPIHVHINNYNILRYVGKAIIGNTMEISFALKNKYTFVEGDNNTDIDVRDCQDRMEVNLNEWNNFFK